MCCSVAEEQSPSTINIDSPEGMLLYLRLLIKYRDKFPKSKCHDSVYDSLRGKLVKLGVCTTVENLRNKRRLLRDQHRRHSRDKKTDHEYYVACCVIFDGDSMDKVKDTRFDPEGDLDSDSDTEETLRNRELLKFSKGEAEFILYFGVV